jgi:hypothetical protein
VAISSTQATSWRRLWPSNTWSQLGGVGAHDQVGGIPLVLRLGVEPVEVADPPDRPAEHFRPGSRYSAECRAVARERSTIPDAMATVHDAMLGVDEVIARAPTAAEISADITGLGQQAVYLVTGPRRCRRLPAGPPGGSRPLPALEAAARPTGPGGNQVAVLARSQRGGPRSGGGDPLGFPVWL